MWFSGWWKSKYIIATSALILPPLFITITHVHRNSLTHETSKLSEITFTWSSPPLHPEFSLNWPPYCQLVAPCSWTSRVAQPCIDIKFTWKPPEIGFVSHNESFSDCHGRAVRRNDNFDANLLIIHRRNPRLRSLGKNLDLFMNRIVDLCNQWSVAMASRIIWL